ncbi:MAG: hypothetical protein ABA06_02585 [Parcubacteria bacterium C7867-001]|nr:MAG: hypothetical protein ABA06_02585 [Parcubacteria bacterium C7867-001]
MLCMGIESGKIVARIGAGPNHSPDKQPKKKAKAEKGPKTPEQLARELNVALTRYASAVLRGDRSVWAGLHAGVEKIITKGMARKSINSKEVLTAAANRNKKRKEAAQAVGAKKTDLYATSEKFDSEFNADIQQLREDYEETSEGVSDLVERLRLYDFDVVENQLERLFPEKAAIFSHEIERFNEALEALDPEHIRAHAPRKGEVDVESEYFDGQAAVLLRTFNELQEYFESERKILDRDVRESPASRTPHNARTKSAQRLREQKMEGALILDPTLNELAGIKKFFERIALEIGLLNRYAVDLTATKQEHRKASYVYEQARALGKIPETLSKTVEEVVARKERALLEGKSKIKGFFDGRTTDKAPREEVHVFLKDCIEDPSNRAEFVEIRAAILRRIGEKKSVTKKELEGAFNYVQLSLITKIRGDFKPFIEKIAANAKRSEEKTVPMWARGQSEEKAEGPKKKAA